MIRELSKVIDIDKEKCVNCHKCISACPVKYSNNGSQDNVTAIPDKCIGCGHCVRVCTHNARTMIDDFGKFLEAVKNKEKIVAIVAPSIAAQYPKTYLNLNGYLKSIGIDAIFDVSFGAELTVKSYIEYIKKNNPKMVISQPCASIVTYIEIYQPQLLKYLAPVDSPMMHTMKLIRNYYQDCKCHKIAVISPCLAKRREFDEVGIGDYNIIFKSLDDHLKENNIDLNDFPETEFDNPPAERAVLFSTPGGLLRTAERELPGLRDRTRKIEGINMMYEYIQKLPEVLEKDRAPLLIDCLNCELGCNGGPGTLNQDKSPDEIEFHIEERKKKMLKIYEDLAREKGTNTQEVIHETLDKYWDGELYSRTYEDISDNNDVLIPGEKEVEEIYKKMYKFSEEDIYNCASCGYGSCFDMATAIYNNLNRPENCHFYMEKRVKEEHIRLLEEEKKAKQAAESEYEMKKHLEVMQKARIREMEHHNDSLSKLNKAYSCFVPRQFLSLLGQDSIVNLRLGDQIKKKMTILFSDIRSFTTFSEEMDPQENFNFLNSYLDQMNPHIRKYNGFIDKYIGDAIMALFPDTPDDALNAAIDMQNEISFFNFNRKQEGAFQIEVGMGIHIGAIMLGILGSENRMEGTVISDAVNTASRLEDLTKIYGSQIIISKDLMDKLTFMPKCRNLGEVNVKGKKQSITIYEVLDARPSDQIELLMETKQLFETGITHFNNNLFDTSLDYFKKVLAKNTKDTAAQHYVKRCQKFIKFGVPPRLDEIKDIDE